MNLDLTKKIDRHNLIKKPKLLAILLTASFTLNGCSTSKHYDSSITNQKTVSFIAFGDSGYHYDYVKAKKFTPAIKSFDDFQEKKRKKWIKKNYPEGDFQNFPAHFDERHGSYIDASGLMPVADKMYSKCRRSGCDFALMLGDNIYPDGATLGSDGFDDKTRFDKLFSQPYGRFSNLGSDFNIYVTLGNHDWHTSRAGALAQVDFIESTSPFYMDGLFYSVKPIADSNDVELFFIDTEMLISTTNVYEDKLNPDGSEVNTGVIEKPIEWAKPSNQTEVKMLDWLENALDKSTAKWKFVIGHHPIWSSGGTKFTQARALRKLLMPTLCKYSDAYIAGHEHTLELHEDTCENYGVDQSLPPLVEVVSGAAAKQRGINRRFADHQNITNNNLNSIWAKGMIWGYSYITLKGNNAKIEMFSIDPKNNDERLEFSYEFTKRITKPNQ